MTPSAALRSDVFLIYLGITAGLLILSGAAIAVLGWGLKRDVGQAWNSYRGWLVMVPLLLLCIFLGRAATIVLFTALAVFGFKEFARATGLYRDWWITGVAYLGIIAVGSLYIGWMFGHLVFLANAKFAYGYLLYLIFAVELNDVAAFTCGKLFGRHPLRSNISPKKTWEGALGALAVSLALPWILHFSFPHFTALQCVLTGLIVGIGGQLGDLSISMIKRDLGIKDIGAAIPGHGGILDRIDSMIYVAPLFFHMMRWFHDLY